MERPNLATIPKSALFFANHFSKVLCDIILARIETKVVSPEKPPKTNLPMPICCLGHRHCVILLIMQGGMITQNLIGFFEKQFLRMHSCQMSQAGRNQMLYANEQNLPYISFLRSRNGNGNKNADKYLWMIKRYRRQGTVHSLPPFCGSLLVQI